MIRDTETIETKSNSNNKTIDNSLICHNEGKDVPKSSVYCEVKSGCRAIQKTGECCPQYQCGKFSLELYTLLKFTHF